MTSNMRDQLLHFIEGRVFLPILNASPDRYSAADQRVLKEVQRRTEQEKQQFSRFETAEEIRSAFEMEIQSTGAETVHRELKRLGLPQFADVQDEFFALCERLNVSAHAA